MKNLLKYLLVFVIVAFFHVVPRQIQFTGSFRVQCSSRRTTSMQRTVSEFLKSGKSFNISSLNSVGKNNIVINISVIEHAHKLVYLGKLII